MAARSPYLIDVGNNKVVLLQVVKTSISNVADDLGMTELPATGELPAGKTQVGQGRRAAMENGCFPIILVYQISSTKQQRAKVLCSPSKSDTIFVDGRSATYRGKNIIRVEIPKRRILAF